MLKHVYHTSHSVHVSYNMSTIPYVQREKHMTILDQYRMLLYASLLNLIQQIGLNNLIAQSDGFNNEM